MHEALGHNVSQAAAPVSIGVSKAQLEACETTVREKIGTVLQVLAHQGSCQIVEIEWPSPRLVFAASTAIMFSEASAIHRRHLGNNPEYYGPDVRQRLHTGSAIPATSYVDALYTRQTLSALVKETFSQIDFFLEPTVNILAPKITEASDPIVAGRLVANTRLANLTGVPALSLPIPGASLPVGLQLTAANDTMLLAAAAFVETLINDNLYYVEDQ